MRNDAKQGDHKQASTYLFIPGFLFIGMGVGFLYGQLVAGLFIGLGAGMVMSALVGSGRKAS